MIANNKIQEKERDIAMMGSAGYHIPLPRPIGELIHEPTQTHISVYKPIGRFGAWMPNKCFGLKYKKL